MANGSSVRLALETKKAVFTSILVESSLKPMDIVGA
jgi:hypothetical protein